MAMASPWRMGEEPCLSCWPLAQWREVPPAQCGRTGRGFYPYAFGRALAASESRMHFSGQMSPAPQNPAVRLLPGFWDGVR